MKRDYTAALALAGGTALVLVAMIGVTAVTGASQEQHEHVTADYAASLVAQAGPARLLFGLDIAFVGLYTAFFAALASILRRAQPKTLGADLAGIAFVLLLAVAVLDVIEDHHILALLRLAELGKPLDDGALAWQQVLSSTKFSLSYLSLVLYGLAIPRTTRLAWALATFLVVGTLVNAVVDYAISPAAHAAIDGGRWIGFLAGFGLAGAWLAQQRRGSQAA